MAVKGDPTSIAAKWANRLGAAGDEIKAGVMRVQQAPGAKAAAAADLWIQQLTASKAKWQRRVASVSLTEWQNAMITTGIGRIQQGAQAKQAKVATFMGQLLPYIEAGQRQIDQMPKGGIQNSIARMTAWTQYMNKFQYGAPSGTGA